MIIKIDAFAGMIPKQGPRLLNEQNAVTALNAKVISGELKPWKAPLSVVASPTKPGILKTLFMYRDLYWLAWTTDVDVVRSPIKGDASHTIYWTGDGVPKITDDSVASTPSGDSPVTSYTLGVPAPTTALIATIAGADSVVAPETSVATQYVYTNVFNFNGKTMESAPSPISAAISYDSAKLGVTTQRIDLSGMDTSVTGNYPISGATKRIYRVDSGLTGSQFLLVYDGTLLSSPTYSDSKKSTQLGSAIVSTNYTMPPSEMIGLTSMANGILAGFQDNKILFSEIFKPHAWPSDYYLATDYPIVGLASFGNSLVVCTTGNTYLVTGTSPQSMSMVKLGVQQACVSKRSIMTVGDGVIYSSPDGLVQVSGRTAQLITHNLYSRSDWQALNPTTMTSAYHNNLYYAFHSTGAIVFDMSNLELGIVNLDTIASAAHVNAVTDALYLVVGSSISRWDAGANQSYSWRSKIWVSPKPTSLSCGKVSADTYPVFCKVYEDGDLKHTQQVLSDEAFRLPSGYMAKELQFEFSGTATIYYAHFATSMAELRSQ